MIDRSTSPELPNNKIDSTLAENTIPTTILFIDYENITQVRLSTIQRSNLKIYIFVGCTQAKIPFELVREAHQLGASVEWIGVEGIGPNALDFHIVFYLGQISLQSPSSNYVILSRDRGFDPLIQHLDKLGISCKRIDNLEILSHQSDLTHSQEFLADIVFAKLETTDPKSRPKTKPALYKYIRSLLAKYQLSEPEVERLLETLFQNERIVKSKSKISYKLSPSESISPLNYPW
jgi:PIN domain